MNPGGTIGLRGFRLIIATLGAIKAERRTVKQLTEFTGIEYVSQMRIVNELRKAGLIYRDGQAEVIHGMRPYLYAFRGGEAKVGGRPLTASFLELWNAMLIPDSAQSISDEAGVSVNHTRKTIHEMRRAGLAYRAEWKRNDVSLPTALWTIGDKRCAPRIKPLPESEYNRRSNRKRTTQRLVKLVATQPWSLLCTQLRKAA
jgi:hypothetical protein